MGTREGEVFEGHCLCGAVRFRVAGGFGPIVHCHCSICRRSSGSAFASNASVDASAFMILSGGGAIREYESSPGYFRAFCSLCGSPVYGRSARSPGVRRVRMGTLDNAPATRPLAHVWTDARAPWFALTDDLERFGEMPPPSYLLPRSAAGG